MIRTSQSGHLEFTGVQQLVIEALARYLEISVDDVILRLLTPTRSERERMLKHLNRLV